MAPGDYLELLKRWAAPRGLAVVASQGTQREPEHVVAVREPGARATTLVSRTSMDSVEVAAMYVVNTLERLGVELTENDRES